MCGTGPQFRCFARQIELDLLTDLRELFTSMDPTLMHIVTCTGTSGESSGSNGKKKLSPSTIAVQVAVYTDTDAILSANFIESSKRPFENVDTVRGDCRRRLKERLQRLLTCQSAVDEHTADQLIVFMAFLPGTSQVDYFSSLSVIYQCVLLQIVHIIRKCVTLLSSVPTMLCLLAQILVEPCSNESSLHLVTSIEMAHQFTRARFSVKEVSDVCYLSFHNYNFPIQILCTFVDARLQTIFAKPSFVSNPLLLFFYCFHA